MSDVAAIVARDLDVGYAGRAVVRGIDVELPAGGLLCLIGTNGSGKSTLLKTLAGLIQPVRGAVAVVGVENFEDEAAQVADGIHEDAIPEQADFDLQIDAAPDQGRGALEHTDGGGVGNGIQRQPDASTR
jgi:ABC-type multidrug transport system ATPase subunit